MELGSKCDKLIIEKKAKQKSNNKIPCPPTVGSCESHKERRRTERGEDGQRADGQREAKTDREKTETTRPP